MPSEEHNVSPKIAVILFFVISILILTGAWIYYTQEQKSLKEDRADALRAVAMLKSSQISSWYLDEIHDARIIANNNLLVEQIERYMEAGAKTDLAGLRKILINTAQEHGYQYVLFSDTLWNLITAEDIQHHEHDPQLQEAVTKAMHSRDVHTTGLYLCSQHKTIHIDFVASVTGDQGQLLGVLIFQIDPFEQFYPLIQSWPTPSKSSETMLVSKETDSIRFLNELRHVKNTALKLTLPLNDTNYTAVKAVSGLSGIVEGKDYRGISVISYVDSIPGTPWYMVSETDKSEVLEGLRSKGVWVAVFVVIMILMAGFGVGYMFTAKQKNLFKILFNTREEFRATLNSIGDAVITTDTEGRITYLNSVAEQLTGCNRFEARNQALDSIFSIVNEYSRKPIENPVRRVLREGKISAIANHSLMILKDGREIPIADSGAPILDEERKTVGVVLVFRDQTEERKSARELVKSERRYRLLFENHTAVKLLIDARSGNIVNANNAAERFYGWSTEALCRMNINQINTLSDEEVALALADARNRKRVFFEFKHRLADNTIRDVEVYSSVVETKDRELIHSIIHDVTARKQAEEQLRLLSKSVDQSPVNIIITNAIGKIEYVNSGFTKMTGYSREEALGRNPKFMSSGMHVPAFYKGLWKTITSGKDWQGEFINKRKSGENYWESAVITPVMNESGEITHFIGIKEDVSSMKKMVEELVSAKEKAEESERLKSAFLANMSHEIRTPLNGILGFTNLLTSGERLSIAKKQQYNDIINKSAEGLLRIINDILDISRLDAHQMEIERNSFNVNDTLSRIYDLFKMKLEDADNTSIDLRVFIPNEPIILDNDEKRLSQVLTNLLENALKFTPKGNIEFGVSSVTPSNIEIFVKDSGIGIPPEKHRVIFDRFRQADDTIAITYGGSGLGLAIVKQLVKLMGGEIRLVSEVGKGTSFSIILPLQIDNK